MIDAKTSLASAPDAGKAAALSAERKPGDTSMSFGLSRRALMANAAALSSLAAGCGTMAAHSDTNDVLGDLDATGIADHVRRGDFTPAEALEAAIARAEAMNPNLNFMASKAYEYGRVRAAAQPRSGPFAGVPTLIKDLTDVAGLPTHYGSRAFANNVAERQTPYIDAVEASGCVVFGKSTTPEFGLTATTEPLLGGATRNPWNPALTCGGSSGGAGAAVAARVVPIAHASDGGGSIRIPASCNGLVGLKVSRGRHLTAGRPDTGISLSVWGSVSRSVRDTAAWYALTERSDASAPFPAIGMVTGANRRRLRINVSIPTTNGDEPTADVRAAIEGVAEVCRRLGHDVRDQPMRFSNARQFNDDFILLWAESAAEVVQLVRQQAPGAPLDQLLEPLTLDLAQHFADAPDGEFAAAIERLRAAGAEYQSFFDSADVFLTPTLASTPPAIGEMAPTLGMARGFARVIQFVGYTPVQNVAGAPAISLPLGWSPAGLPIGAHFCAARGQERTLLELAYELEAAMPWANRRPAVNAG